MIQKLKAVIKTILIYLYDFYADLRYSTLVSGEDSQEKMLSSLVVSAHTIEKGLTMPNKRFPFGENKAMEILQKCKLYIDKGYSSSESRFIDVVGIMKEYRDVTKEHGFTSPQLNNYIDNLLQCVSDDVNLSQRYSVTFSDYFSQSSAEFMYFSNSRHSCRNLIGHVNDEVLKQAIALSMNAPSTCNRQSHRVHLLQSQQAKNAILSIQGGCRGFGDLADQFILLTSDLSCWSSGPVRNGPYVDGGIYLMNLLYCLHHYKIAACTLNLYLDRVKTKQLHVKLNIPFNEVPIALIAIGIPPMEFDLARSHRRDSDEIITNH